MKNALPVITSFTADTTQPLGTVEFHATFTDAGANDAPFHYTIKWGDGTPDYADVGSVVIGGPEHIDEDHVYAKPGNYGVTLTVTDKDGGVSISKMTIGPAAHMPHAQANSAFTTTEGTTVPFSSLGSTDPDGLVLRYLWDFGDGTTSRMANPTHKYNVRGTYNVTLTVTNSWGVSDVATSQVTVEDTPPTVKVIIPAKVNENTSFQLTVVSVKDPNPADQAGVTYQYDCGDGDGYSPPVADMFYNCPGLPDNGTLTAQIKVNSGPAEVVTSKTVNIANVPPVLFGVFGGVFNPFAPPAAVPTSFVVGDNVTFFVAALDPAPNDGLLSITVNWGEGSATTIPFDSHAVIGPFPFPLFPTFSHVWTRSGPHTVKVKVTDKDGGSVTFTLPVTVDPII